jgi:hypothetical protein
VRLRFADKHTLMQSLVSGQEFDYIIFVTNAYMYMILTSFSIVFIVLFNMHKLIFLNAHLGECKVGFILYL